MSELRPIKREKSKAICLLGTLYRRHGGTPLRYLVKTMCIWAVVIIKVRRGVGANGIWAWGMQLIWTFIHEPYYLLLPLTQLHLSKYIYNISIAFQIKSSSTWVIPASLCEGPFFYFYVESSSSKFMHQLREHSCHSEYNVHSPKTYWLTHCYDLLVLELLVSSHPLNFKGVLAFMFCYNHKGQAECYFIMFTLKQTVAFSALLFMLFCLSYFLCYNIVAKFLLELYLSCLCL
jgi:hypothetical protein